MWLCQVELPSKPQSPAWARGGEAKGSVSGQRKGVGDDSIKRESEWHRSTQLLLQRGQGNSPSTRGAAPHPEIHVSDFASCFTSPCCGHVTDSSAQASPRPRGTGGSAASPCHFSEPGMLLTVRLTQFVTGMEGEGTCSMMPLNTSYSFWFTSVWWKGLFSSLTERV